MLVLFLRLIFFALLHTFVGRSENLEVGLTERLGGLNGGGVSLRSRGEAFSRLRLRGQKSRSRRQTEDGRRRCARFLKRQCNWARLRD